MMTTPPGAQERDKWLLDNYGNLTGPFTISRQDLDLLVAQAVQAERERIAVRALAMRTATFNDVGDAYNAGLTDFAAALRARPAEADATARNIAKMAEYGTDLATSWLQVAKRAIALADQLLLTREREVRWLERDNAVSALNAFRGCPDHACEQERCVMCQGRGQTIDRMIAAIRARAKEMCSQEHGPLPGTTLPYEPGE